MNLISHSFLALAAAVMAAGPVLSCCAAGHLDSAGMTAEHDASAPPCHGTPEPEPVDDCAGCASCAASAAGPDLTLGVTLLVTDSELDEAAVARPSVSGLSLGAPPEATGPPPRRPLAHATPISLKQRLLI